MKEKNRHEKQPSLSEDQRLAALGIHAAETAAESGCISEQDMAWFIDKATIDDPQFAAFYQHLAQCEDCYHTWLNLSQLQQEKLSRKIFSLLAKPSSLSLVGSAFAVAATLFIVFQFPSKDLMHKQLTQPQSMPQQTEILQEKQDSDDVFSLGERNAVNDAERPAPPPAEPGLRAEADSKSDSSALKREKRKGPKLSSAPVKASAISPVDLLKSEIGQFCQQPSYDEKKKSQLLEKTAQLLNNEQTNSELSAIADILTRMEPSTRQQLCLQMESILKK